jgi:nucleoside 2-deoxyribosyltransferase
MYSSVSADNPVQMYPKSSIYLAAPLFSESEKRYNAYVRDLLTQAGHITYLPQEQGEDVGLRTRKDDHTVFNRHLQALELAEAVVAIYDGPDADSGTAWEAGYAYAKGIPVLALRTDNRMIGAERSINLMLEHSSYIVTTLDDLLSLLPTVLSCNR